VERIDFNVLKARPADRFRSRLADAAPARCDAVLPACRAAPNRATGLFRGTRGTVVALAPQNRGADPDCGKFHRH
jgi:hypothetical protein